VERLLLIPVNRLYTINGNITTDAGESLYTQRGWVRADSITLSDKLFSPVNGLWINVTSIKSKEGAILTYDIIGNTGLRGSTLIIVVNGYYAVDIHY